MQPGTLYEIADNVFRIASEKGFDAPDWETNFPAKLLLVITELDEAVQWIEGHGKDPIGVELADTAIRLLSTLRSIWGRDWSAGRVEYRRVPSRIGTFEPLQVTVWPIIRNVCGAVECWRRNGTAPVNDFKEAMICMELALLETFRAADRLGIDLHAEILAKAEKNAAREKLHGKGRSVG
jgi:hypothetical protein